MIGLLLSKQPALAYQASPWISRSDRAASPSIMAVRVSGAEMVAALQTRMV